MKPFSSWKCSSIKSHLINKYLMNDQVLNFSKGQKITEEIASKKSEELEIQQRKHTCTQKYMYKENDN